MKRLWVILQSLFAIWISLNATTPFGLLTANPAPNSEQSIIQNINLTFDIADIKDEHPDVSTWYIGCSIAAGYNVVLKKGNDIIAEVTTASTALVAGESFEISFDNPIALEEGVEYKLCMDACAFSVCKAKRAGKVEDSAYIEFNYIGKASESKILVLESIDPPPNSELSALTEVRYNFNEEVEVDANANATIIDKSTSEILASSKLSISESEKTVCANFNELNLYKDHSYELIIPENAIWLKGVSNSGYQQISISYAGASIKYFGYDRITPANNREVSYLAAIDVPVDCSDDEYLGRDFKAVAQLYLVDGESETQVGEDIECSVNEMAKGFYIDVYNFNLEADKTYKVVVAEDQFHKWSYETQKPLHDTANSRLELTYYTPTELEPVAKQSFGAVTPETDGSIDAIDGFKLMFEPYKFNNTFYYPVFPSTLVEGYNVLDVMDVTTGKKVADFKVDIKWDDDNNYWIENEEAMNVTLYSGHDYQIVIPAGMFCCRFQPLAEVSANAEYVINYTGAYRTKFDLTYVVAGESSIKTSVNRGEEVSFTVTPDKRDLVSVYFNEEDVTGKVSEDGIYTTPAINDDAKVTVTLSELAPVVKEPEHVNVYLEVGDHVAVTHKVAKEKDATVSVAPTANWTLSKLTLNDADVTKDVAENGDYTIPAASLVNDANLKAVFAYNGSPEFDFTTSVDGIVEGCDYKVHSENGTLVIENVPANAHVAIYSVAGLLVKDGTNADNTDMIRINLNPGVYVVIINNDALKVRHQ